MGAQDEQLYRHRDGAPPRPLQLLYAPAYRTFKTYVLKGGWRCGWPGLVHAVLDGMYRFILLAKLLGERRSYPDMERDARGEC